MNLQKLTKIIYSFFRVKVPGFFNNAFEVSYSRVSKIVGSALCICSLILVILCINTFTTLSVSTRWLLMAVDLFLPFLIAACTIYTVRLKNETARKICGFVILLLMPIALMTITECLNNVFIYDMTHLGFLGNYVVILIAYFIFFALTGSFKTSYLIVNTVLFGLAMGHSYVMDFRGTPFQPMDFLSISTAAGVANTYDFTPNYKVITALFLFILLTVIAIKMKTPKYSLPVKIISRSATLTVSSVLLILFYATSIFADMGVKPDFWNQTRGYHNYGFVFNFIANTKYLYKTAPSDYDPNQIDQVIDSQKEEEEISTKNIPNIICIMNESLSDLKVLGEFETNEDYMPFMRSLTENTIKGNLYVPVIGAGTSNTEFEFLTGHTTAFLPSGSNAYMLYVKQPMASLVSTLEAQKFSSYALHPYYASGWRRTAVYSNFGFNKFCALENIMDISLMEEYQQSGNDADYLQSLVEQMYPDIDNMLVRQYISDSYNYELLIEDFKNRDKHKPYFAFNVTMQNHGGYTKSCINFPETIKITSSQKDYIKANKYLSLVKQSDDAFKELIEYFSKVKERTIICMFGDHQPSIEPAFISEVLGVDNLSDLTIEQEQKRHMTQFYIWANYDIEEQEIDKLSANYLSALVLKTAGVKLTKYDNYLLELSQTLPVINTVGYIDKDNNYYKWSDISPYTALLSEYENLQYNAIFDTKNFKKDTFFLKDYVHEASILTESEETQKND